MKFRPLLFLYIVICCVSCSKGLSYDEKQAGDGGETYVTISLNVLKEKEEDGTKAVIDDDDPSFIKNIKVVQYSGTSDDSFLEGDISWLEESDFSISDNTIKASIRLVSGNQSTTVFFIANSFDKGMVPPRTLGEMKALCRPITSSNECLGFDGNNYYPMFTGWCELPSVDENTEVNATLSRNVARFTFHIVNSSHTIAAKLTVKSVSIESVPNISYYFPEEFASSIFPEHGTFSPTNYSPVEWPADIIQGETKTSADFVFYLPVNKRGSADNDDPMSKNKYAPTEASYALINCDCYDPDSKMQIPVTYRIYLGANMTDDFNITNNRSYTFNITLKSKGNASIDSRITDYGPVDFSVASRSRSNCYILNPPTSDGYWRTFTIPVDRVDTFWGYGYNSTTAPYEYETNYQLSPSKPWKVEVIWSDFTIDNAANFRFAGPDASSFLGSGTEGFRVQVPKGAKGNVIVGIRRNDTSASPYLWSWHLWITDYSPDDAVKKYIPSDSIFEYSVTGGKCYRLDFDAWKEGQTYAHSFIMDRNVGALDTYYHSPADRGNLFYQFGRKDPFWKGMTGMNIVSIKEIPENPLVYLITKPETLILTEGATWVKESKYNPADGAANLLWHDPCATVSNHAKSIFDPCPEGWKVPERTALTGENSSNMLWFQDSNNQGRQYKGSLIFQQTGWLNGFSGGAFNNPGGGNYWMATHHSDLHRAYAFEFSNESLSDNDRCDMTAHGFAVRCVSDSN